MANREADRHDLFVETPCPAAATDWLARGQHDRFLANGKTLRQLMAEAAVPDYDHLRAARPPRVQGPHRP
ncbi:MAG TPA: hypothetical protein VES73_16500 [Lamprocystis sp. (in: g-proteobacteria)]|nr:hypothetical protein [Lamprocystis sp. (in: g-proteobacteria)]